MPQRRHRSLLLAAIVTALFAVGAAPSTSAAETGADLSLSLVAPPAKVTVGDTVTYVITVKNVSSTPARNLYIRDLLPGGLLAEDTPGRVRFKSLKVSDSTLDCGVGYGVDVGCQFQREFAGGESVTLTVIGTAETVGTHEAGNEASTYELDRDDPKPADNGVSTKLTIAPKPGTRHADNLRGGAGNDVLKGLAGNDVLNGGAGHDKLYGGAGSDKLTGGPGNDLLVGGGGKDGFSAGPGKDKVDSADGIKETVNCGTGADTATADSSDRLIGCEIRHLRRS